MDQLDVVQKREVGMIRSLDIQWGEMDGNGAIRPKEERTTYEI